jgi:hypothetical protein
MNNCDCFRSLARIAIFYTSVSFILIHVKVGWWKQKLIYQKSWNGLHLPWELLISCCLFEFSIISQQTLLNVCRMYPTDPNVRVAGLTCLGSVVLTSTPLLEVCHIIEPSRPSHRSSDYVANSNASASSNLTSSVNVDNLSPCVLTPALSSGAQTPGAASGPEADAAMPPTSWLIRLCVRFVVPQLAIDFDGSRQSTVQPLPVRLESLQLLALLAKGYFGILRFVVCSGI